jgi:hypothetical protein
MNIHRLKKILFTLVLPLIAYAPKISAQQVTATLSGTVSDQTGGVVPGAHVVATNTGTNAPLQRIPGLRESSNSGVSSPISSTM